MDGPGAAGSTLVIRGTVEANEDLTLTGRVEGTIHVPNHALSVGPHAHITADIQAGSVSVEGRVTGNLQVRERVALDSRSTVSGDIKAARVEMRDGARFDGRIDMPANLRAVTAA